MVLVRDARLGGEVNEVIPIRADDSGHVPLKQVSTNSQGQVWTLWLAPLKNGKTVTLCDFASAGNTWSDASQYRVWLPQQEH